MKNIRKKLYSLLRWSEKYTKTDMVYLASGMSWLTVGQLTSSLSAFLLAIAFANFLPKEVYGNYKFILSIASLLAIPTLQEMKVAVARAIAQKKDGTAIAALKKRLYWGSFGSLIGIGGAIYYYINGDVTLSLALLIAAFFVPVMESLDIYQSILQGKKEFGVLTKYFTITRIISSIVIFVTIAFFPNLFLLLGVYFISYCLLRFFFLQKTLRFRDNDLLDSETLRYGTHLSFIRIPVVIAAHLDKILLFHFLGAVELAIYMFATAIPEQIKGFLKGIPFLALPKFSENTTLSRQDILSKTIRLALFIVPIIVLYIFAAPFIYKIFFPQYLDSIFISQLYSFTLIVALAFIPLSNFEAQKATKLLFGYNMFSSIVLITSLLVLIPPLGLVGAVIAHIVSRISNLLYLLFTESS